MRYPHDVANIVGAMLGNYRVIGELSRGGMGSVYRARHELLGKPAAVKLLRPELTGDPELVERFFNEAKATTAIEHPGIIQIYDFGHTDDGQAYIVMELLEGEPLATRIEARGKLPEEETAQIARGIASALTAAHGKGIVHRDLKPDNVFLVPDPDVPGGERPKVLDFGIAKLQPNSLAGESARHTVTGALMGTPLYMAPEQARGAGEIDHRADLYSLGCIAYELIVGQPPFVAEGAGEIIALQLFGKAVAPSRRGVDVDPDLEALVMELLEKDPAQRVQTAAEVVERLDRLLGNAVAVTSRGTASPRVPKLVTRNGGRSTDVAELVPTEQKNYRQGAKTPSERRWPPWRLGALAVILLVVVIVIVRGWRDEPVVAKPPPPVAAPPPPPAPPTPPPAPPAPVEVQVTPPPPPVVKKHPVVKKQESHKTGEHDSNGNPIETTLGP